MENPNEQPHPHNKSRAIVHHVIPNIMKYIGGIGKIFVSIQGKAGIFPQTGFVSTVPVIPIGDRPDEQTYTD